MEILKRVGRLVSDVFAQSRIMSFTLIFVMLSVGALEALGVICLVPVIEFLSKASEPSKYSLKIFEFLKLFSVKPGLYVFLFVFGGVILFKAFVKFLSKYLVLKLQVSYESYISKIVFESLMNSNWRFFSEIPEGDLSNILVGEVRKVGDCLYYLFDFVALVIKFAFYSAVLLSFSFKLSLIILSLSIVVGGIPLLISKLIHSESVQRVSYTNEIQDFIFQIVSNFSLIKVFSTEGYFSKRYCEKVDNYTGVHGRVRLLSDISGIFFEPLGVAQISFIIYLSFSIFKIPFAEVLVILFTLRTSIPLLGQMLTYANVIVSSSASHSSVVELVDKASECREQLNCASGISEPRAGGSNISLESVSVYYGDTAALRDLSLQIKENEFVAFVGTSGSGKSTLIRLLTGLIFPSKGSFKVGDKPLEALSLSTWRKRIGFVPQTPNLLKGSLANNVAFGVDFVDKPRVIESMIQSNIYDYVKNLPDKEDSIVGNGVNLSGGQAQRISISRALYRMPDFILMDEPTSALDSSSEKAVLDTILRLKSKKTIILVTHDLRLTENCDKIFVLEKGSLVESGSYGDLQRANGMFSELLRQGGKTC